MENSNFAKYASCLMKSDFTTKAEFIKTAFEETFRDQPINPESVEQGILITTSRINEGISHLLQDRPGFISFTSCFIKCVMNAPAELEAIQEMISDGRHIKKTIEEIRSDVALVVRYLELLPIQTEGKLPSSKDVASFNLEQLIEIIKRCKIIVGNDLFKIFETLVNIAYQLNGLGISAEGFDAKEKLLTSNIESENYVREI